MPAGIRHRRLTKGSIDVPVTPFRIERKLGFKDSIHCICGASLDPNKGKVSMYQREQFRLTHQDCLPAKVAQDATQE